MFKKLIAKCVTTKREVKTINTVNSQVFVNGKATDGIGEEFVKEMVKVY